MSDANESHEIDRDEGRLTLEDAVYIARDGIELLECVDDIEDGNAASGRLRIATERGNFLISVSLEGEATAESLSDECEDGYWGTHPVYHVDQWHDEVACLNTRLGYWDWVLKRIQDAEADQKLDASANQSSDS